MASLNDTTMTIRVNSATKKQAQSLFSELGMDMSTAINVFLKRAVQEERIPFEVGKVKEPNLKTRQAIKRVEDKKDLVGPFNTVEEAMEYLNA
ncbi:MAG: type II toxin-antitoxin system RelB/DinJ family antitoxin [Candidatus Saccharibacteria bacterium]|nr:type II toxin-antitoxin system RelB/DinJ family antitoxin [Candidatus Saccharibacteria bacterium]